MRQLDVQMLKATIAQSDDVVVALFGAAWSAPSRRVQQVLGMLESAHKYPAIFVVVDVAAYPSDLEAFKIVGVPTVCYFKHSKEKGRLAGIHAQKAYEDYLAGRGVTDDAPTATAE